MIALLAAVTDDQDPVDRLVRDRARDRTVLGRARDRARPLADPSRSARPRGIAAHRDRRGVLRRDLHRGAVGVRAERRSVPGDAHERRHASPSRPGRGRRVRGLRQDGRAHRDAARVAALVELLEARAPRRTRVLRADVVLGHGHDADDVGQRPHHRVPVARDPLDRALRAGRVRPAPRHVPGVGPQVLHPRFVLVGGVPLRRRARIRRHRDHQPHGYRRLPREARRCCTTACSCSASRSCSSGSASRSRPRRSTCGPPTCIKVRRRP